MHNASGADDGALPCDPLVVPEAQGSQMELAGREGSDAEGQAPFAELPQEVVAVSTDPGPLTGLEVLDDQRQRMRCDALTS